jgi:hypothetical protein
MASVVSLRPSKFTNMDKFNRLEDLRSLYRSTFREWASQVAQLDEIRDSVQAGDGFREAEERTAHAEAGYRHARNRLVDEMADAGCYALVAEKKEERGPNYV